MPFVLPPGVAIGSQQSIYLKALYDSEQAAAAGMPLPMTPLGYQQISNDALATVQQLTVPAGATIAVIENNGSQPCRWRDDPGSPTEKLGRVLAPDGELTYTGNLSALKLIRGADGVTLDISYYK